VQFDTVTLLNLDDQPLSSVASLSVQQRCLFWNALFSKSYCAADERLTQEATFPGAMPVVVVVVTVAVASQLSLIRDRRLQSCEEMANVIFPRSQLFLGQEKLLKIRNEQQQHHERTIIKRPLCSV